MSASIDRVTDEITKCPRLQALCDHVSPRLGNDPGHDLAHSLRVAAWTLELGGAELDTRCAIAAALLHDIVNPPKHARERELASERSAEVARELLPEYGFLEAEVNEIADAIRTHSFSRREQPTTLLGRALQDADRLEALGVLGTFRAISAGTRMGSRYTHERDPWARERDLDDTRYCVDHFFTKLLGLEATMQTAKGRTEAKRRTAFMRALLSQLGEELGVPFPGDGCSGSV